MTKVFLYAQPLDQVPYVSKSALKDHSFKEVGIGLGAIGFTDIGKAVWETVSNVYSDFEIDAIDLPFSGSQWAIKFTMGRLRLVLSRKGYKSLEGALGSYISLDFDGEKHAISRFLKSFLKNLGRAPWEIAYKSEFKEKTGVSRGEVADEWERYARHVAAARDAEDEAREKEEERKRKKAAERAKAKADEAASRGPQVKLELAARSFLTFEGEELVLNVRVENRSPVSVEKVQVVARASQESIQFSAPVKVISYLKPSEALTLTFPLSAPADVAAGEVWTELEGTGLDRKLTARTEARRLRSELPALEPVEIASLAWQKRAGELVRKDEVRAKVYMAASEAFDEMLVRLKGAGLYMLEPEVIRTGTSYLGHLKLHAEDSHKRPFAFALDCVGNYEESKITLHFYAESAELVSALRDRIMAVLAGKK